MRFPKIHIVCIVLLTIIAFHRRNEPMRAPVQDLLTAFLEAGTMG